MRRSRRRSSAPICATCARCWTNTSTRPAFYGHFGHGCIHMRVNFDLETEAGIRKYGEFVDRAADLVVGYGGSLSGEHGDGQSRGALLPKMFGDELMGAFREFKAIWDPDNKLNPHKVDRRVPANREPAARRRLRAAPADHALRVSRRWRLAANERRCAASAWASAASTTRDRCARATW